jgi:type 1 glutamine amidotransferase
MNRPLALCIRMRRCLARGGPISVMILDGESGGTYHDWQRVTPVLKKDARRNGPLRDHRGDDPAAQRRLQRFMPDFTKYQVVVLNYDAPDDRWPAALKTAFEQYVKNGGGFVSVHAADNAFPAGRRSTRWSASAAGAAAASRPDRTGFQGRQADVGRGCRAAGSHGKRVPFQIAVRNNSHPITKGLPPAWMHQGDELYARLRGPGRNMTVLATAFSDPQNNGSGRDEPQLMVLSYGKGRVFHTTLGHDINALSSVDFVVTLQRGTEWAATGQVTQKVPANFPTATTVSYRADIAAMDPRFADGLDPLTARPAR